MLLTEDNATHGAVPKASTRPTTTEFKDPFSQEVWSQTYKYHKDETVDDTLYRVARYVASAEKTSTYQEIWTDRFNEMLSNFTVVPGGRILANAGTEFTGTTLFNCFTAPRKDYDIDSIEGIIEDVLNQCKTLKSEGGWGQNFSYLRPRGAFIHGIGVETPGAVKYMEIYDKTSDIITSGSGKKSKNKKAKGKIRKGAMMSILDCISGDAMVDTIEGKILLKDLVGKRPYLYCTDGEGNVFVRQANKVWSKGVKKTIKVRLDDGNYIKCTPEHEFMLIDGTYKKAKDLKICDSLCVLNKRLQGKYQYVGVSGSRKQIADHNAIYEMKYGEYPTCLTSETRTGDMTVAHHIDHNTINNHPDNIMRMTIAEHSIHHGDTLAEHRKRISKERRGKTWEEYYGTEKAHEIKEKYREKRKGQPPWNKGKGGEAYKDHYKKGFSNQFTENANHRVLCVEDSNEEEVFDISMPAPYHNFSVNDVFVHNCSHPDIEEFIRAKQQPGRLTKFNMSVNCTDEFMERVVNVMKYKDMLGNLTVELGDDLEKVEQQMAELDKWELRFPETDFERYHEEWDGDLREWEEKGYPVKVYKTVSASGLWNMIMESTYNRAEPGVLFLDRARHFDPAWYTQKIIATNPCSEQQMPSGACCNLCSLNLTQFVDSNRNFDIEKIKKFVRYAVRFLDNINDISEVPLPEYKESMENKRRIGIGVMGWGSALYMMKIPFGSEKSHEIRDKIIKTIAKEAYMASIDLAGEKGMFPDCNAERHATGIFVKNLELSKEYMSKLATIGIRNSSLLSCQPTGNTGVVANVVSGGIEPVFLPEYIRTVIVNEMPEEIEEMTPKWYEGEWNETELFKFDKEGDEEILRGVAGDGTVYKIDKNRGLTKEVLCQDYGVRWLSKRGEWDPEAEWATTTSNLSVSDHVNDLEGFAKWVDSSISKTISVPFDCPFEEFKNIYLDAYKSGCIKGITTYRAGTMTSVLSAKDEKDATAEDEEIITEDVKVPTRAPAIVSTIRADGKKWYLTTIMDEGQKRPIAFFVHTNHHEKGVTTHDAVEKLIALAENKGIPKNWIDDAVDKIQTDNNSTKIARCISLNLRHGVLIKNVVAVLNDVENVFVGSFLFQIRKHLMTWIKDGEIVTNGNGGAKCPECGGQMVYQEGCASCKSCGNSRCG